MPQIPKTRFFLSKWFLDCINERGEGVIIYSAELIWKKINIPYNSLLICHLDGTISFQSRFKKSSTPVKADKKITLLDNVFGIEGEWIQEISSINTRIFETKEGYVDWYCLQPKSKTNIRIKNIGHYSGLGYAERLEMSIEPWKMRMDQLRWGRFNSSGESIVWIEQISNETKQWLWYNNAPVKNAEITDDFIIIHDTDINLGFKNKRVIESEKKIFNIVKSLLSFIPGINKLIPLSFLNAREIKWISKGELKKNGKIIGKGWVIHEYVDFRK